MFWEGIERDSGMKWVNEKASSGLSPSFAANINSSDLINFYSPWNKQKTVFFKVFAGRVEVNYFT